MNTPALHVLQLAKGLDIGGHNGGAENSCLRLARALKQNGVRVSLCAFYRYQTRAEQEWAARLAGEGIKVIFANSSGRLNLAEGIRNITRYASAQGVNLLHSHFQVGTLAGIAVKFRLGIPLLRTAHTPLEFGATLSALPARFLFAQLLYPLVIDREVGVSQNLVRSLNRRWTARLAGKQAVCIYNAIPKPDGSLRNVQPFQAHIQPDEPPNWILTSIGILNPRKRLDVLLRAMPKILQVVPQARAALVGEGPEEPRLRALARQLGIEQQVWFLGQRSDVPDILRFSNALIHPSEVEALSTVIIEAMQAGTPVIASDIPANRELIEAGAGGTLFPLNHVEALADRVIDLYHHPEQGRSYVERAQAALSRFDIETASAAYLYLYQELRQGRKL